MPAEKNTQDLLKLTLNLLIIGLLIAINYYIVEPFLFGFFWAVMLVIPTWPLMIRLQEKLFNKRILAVLAIISIFAFIFIIPFTLMIISITKNSGFVIEWIKNLSSENLPTFDWLNIIPVVGHELHQKWLILIENDGSELIKIIQPYFGSTISWILQQVASLGLGAFHALTMLIFSALLYLNGEALKKYIYHFAARLSRHYGEKAITLAAKSIKAVALGVVVTAITLSLIGGISFALTGMPFAGLLTLLLFICCVAQIGPVIVMLIAIIWQFWSGDVVSASILIVIAAILATLDSFMRAVLIKKGVDLPLLLVLFGVIGGLLAFGMMGLFIGPVILAISYNLIYQWVDEQEE